MSGANDNISPEEGPAAERLQPADAAPIIDSSSQGIASRDSSQTGNSSTLVADQTVEEFAENRSREPVRDTGTEIDLMRRRIDALQRILDTSRTSVPDVRKELNMPSGLDEKLGNKRVHQIRILNNNRAFDPYAHDFPTLLNNVFTRRARNSAAASQARTPGVASQTRSSGAFLIAAVRPAIQPTGDTAASQTTEHEAPARKTRDTDSHLLQMAIDDVGTTSADIVLSNATYPKRPLQKSIWDFLIGIPKVVSMRNVMNKGTRFKRELKSRNGSIAWEAAEVKQEFPPITWCLLFWPVIVPFWIVFFGTLTILQFVVWRFGRKAIKIPEGIGIESTIHKSNSSVDDTAFILFVKNLEAALEAAGSQSAENPGDSLSIPVVQGSLQLRRPTLSSCKDLSVAQMENAKTIIHMLFNMYLKCSQIHFRKLKDRWGVVGKVKPKASAEEDQARGGYISKFQLLPHTDQIDKMLTSIYESTNTTVPELDLCRIMCTLIINCIPYAEVAEVTDTTDRGLATPERTETSGRTGASGLNGSSQGTGSGTAASERSEGSGEIDPTEGGTNSAATSGPAGAFGSIGISRAVDNTEGNGSTTGLADAERSSNAGGNSTPSSNGITRGSDTTPGSNGTASGSDTTTDITADTSSASTDDNSQTEYVKLPWHQTVHTTSFPNTDTEEFLSYTIPTFLHPVGVAFTAANTLISTFVAKDIYQVSTSVTVAFAIIGMYSSIFISIGSAAVNNYIFGDKFTYMHYAPLSHRNVRWTGWLYFDTYMSFIRRQHSLLATYIEGSESGYILSDGAGLLASDTTKVVASDALHTVKTAYISDAVLEKIAFQLSETEYVLPTEPNTIVRKLKIGESHTTANSSDAPSASLSTATASADPPSILFLYVWDFVRTVFDIFLGWLIPIFEPVPQYQSRSPNADEDENGIKFENGCRKAWDAREYFRCFKFFKCGRCNSEDINFSLKCSKLDSHKVDLQIDLQKFPKIKFFQCETCESGSVKFFECNECRSSDIRFFVIEKCNLLDIKSFTVMKKHIEPDPTAPQQDSVLQQRIDHVAHQDAESSRSRTPRSNKMSRRRPRTPIVDEEQGMLPQSSLLSDLLADAESTVSRPLEQAEPSGSQQAAPSTRRAARSPLFSTMSSVSNDLGNQGTHSRSGTLTDVQSTENRPSGQAESPPVPLRASAMQAAPQIFNTRAFDSNII
ncbi:hypothetical protein BZA70DRAFT_64307 [Myxozyma melibiosi]|uniref:Uncharacterized protein n=1 Tax=Myxozyma melibiosi TaxID=54550 RepID=A0ABR1F4B7_9ASCO